MLREKLGRMQRIRILGKEMLQGKHGSALLRIQVTKVVMKMMARWIRGSGMTSDRSRRSRMRTTAATQRRW